MKISKSQRAVYIMISILVAVVFWLYVDNTGANQRDVRLYNVPVTFVGAEDDLAERGLMLTAGEDTKIDLRLQGRRQVVAQLNKNNVKIQVDVRNLMSTGTHTLSYSILYPNSISPNSVTVVSASLYMVTVEVSELHSKTIDVVADINGSVPDGYMLRECVVTPSTITVSGTKEDIAEVDHALVEVTLNGATSSYSEYLSYSLIDIKGNPVVNPKLRCSDDKVRLEVPVVTLKELPLEIDWVESGGSQKSDISYTISPKSIMVSGDESLLNQLDSIQVAQVDLSQVMGDDTLEYDIPLPNGCINESGTDTVKVSIRFRNLQTKTVECSSISFTNVTEGYTASAVTQSLDVTLRGTDAELAKVDGKNVRIVVDLSEMSAAVGTYTAKAKVYVDGTESVGAIGSYQVGYRLQRS